MTCVCEYLTPIKDNDYVTISEGAWSAVVMEVDNNYNYCLYATSDEYTDKIKINYCPFCGRKFSKKVAKKC